MPDKARLDPRWWNQNRPACLSKSAVDKPLSDYVRISQALEKSGEVNAYFKAVSSLKSAIAKDQQTAKKAKDKEAVRMLAEMEKLAHEQTRQREVHLTLKSDLSVKGLSGVAGAGPPPRSDQPAPELVNGGERGWQILRDNKPVGSAKSKSCQALPKQVKATELTGWKTEKADWTCALKNERNEVTVEIDFHLQYRWNGQTPTANGLFLADFGIWADAKIPWGYTVNVEASVDGAPFNSGARDAVVAAIGLVVTVRVATPLKSSTQKWLIVCHGNRQREIK
jgi:hypothetical protein